MYVAFAQVVRLNKTVLAIITGDQAHIIHRWQTDDLSMPYSISFNDVPTIVIGGPAHHDHTYLHWVKGAVRADKYVPRGYPGTAQAPRGVYRSVVVTIPDQPTYSCLGWDRHYVPVLEVLTMFDQRPQLSCIPASLLLMTNMRPCPQRLIPPPGFFPPFGPFTPPKREPDDDDKKGGAKPKARRQLMTTPHKKKRNA